MAPKDRSRSKEGSEQIRTRKTKFQADLGPLEDYLLRSLKAELQIASNTDFLSDAMALFRWAATERRAGHRIISESPSGERSILVFPRLELVAPNEALPHEYLPKPTTTS